MYVFCLANFVTSTINRKILYVVYLQRGGSEVGSVIKTFRLVKRASIFNFLFAVRNRRTHDQHVRFEISLILLNG